MPPAPSSDSSRSGADDAPEKSRRELRLLLVEDNPADARLLEEYLSEASGLSAGLSRARTLGDALDALANGSREPDAVLLDLNLPDADGLETVHRMVDAAPELPVIVLTALDDREMALSAVREGAQDYLLKGEVAPELLSRSVRYALERKRSERRLERLAAELEDERARLQEVFREAPAFLAVLRGEEHVFEMANPTYREMVGGRDLAGRTVRDVFPELEDQAFFEILDEVYRTGETYHADEEPVDLDLGEGLERRYLTFVYQPLTDGGEVTGILALGIDVTEQVEARHEASSQERRLAQILDTVADGILFTDTEGEFAYANPAAEEILGLRRSDITGRTYRAPRWRICGPDGGSFREEDLPVARVLESGEPVSEVEHGVERPDGSRIVLRVNAAPMHSDRGELEGVVASIRDVTEQKRFEAQLEHRALHDHLTDLPNRLLFQDRLQHAIHRAARTGESLAVLFVDLKRFKVINDSIGHDAGDRVLREIGDRLRASVRAQDTVSRLGGDEFTVLLENIEWKGNASAVVDRIVDSLEEPVDLGANRVTVDASVGVALHDGSEDPETVDASDLVQRADRAMYRAKEKPGTAWIMAESEAEETPVTRLERETRLRGALERGEMRTVYHAIYDLASGHVRGVEALARWTDAQLGAVPPGSFIPLAEETGLIVELGEQQLECACRAMLSTGITVPGSGEPLHLNVNLSARQLEDPEVVDRICRVLEETGFPPGRLHLEVTESAAMREPGVVEALKELGVGLAVDDFGTRYSTLAQVQRLTVDTLKIDRTFIDGLPADPKDRAIVETVVTLGSALGLQVVAEGIETEGQLSAVRELGCDLAQGFHLSEPTPRLEDVPLRLRA